MLIHFIKLVYVRLVNDHLIVKVVIICEKLVLMELKAIHFFKELCLYFWFKNLENLYRHMTFKVFTFLKFEYHKYVSVN